MAAEQPIRFSVYPGSSWDRNECFPTLCLEIFWANQEKPDRLWIDVDTFGRKYADQKAASEDAAKIKVQGFDENREPKLDYSAFM